MRSEKEYQKHVTKTISCGTGYSVVIQHFAGAEVLVPVIFRCKSRLCPTCAKIRRAQLISKFKYFRDCGRTIKLELTFTDDSPNPYLFPEYYSHAWDLFLKRLRRRYPKIKYFRVVELQKSGIPHFHILLDHYIPHTWITETFPECGGGKINYIKTVDPGRAINYVLKYVTKSTVADIDLDRFFYMTGMRQFSTSRGLYVFVPRDHTLYCVDSEYSRKFRLLIDSDPDNIYKNFFCICGSENSPPTCCFKLSDMYHILSIFSAYNDNDIKELIFKSRFDLNSEESKSDYAVFI